MKNLFVRVHYDLNDIKEANIWKIGLVDEDCHMLYIETMHDNLSEKLPKERFEEMIANSYFRGLVDIDEKIAKLELSDTVTNTNSNEINIFIKSDGKTRQKIKDYIKEFFPCEDKINLVFKNSFEEVLFMNYMKDTLSDFNIETIGINCHLIDPTDKYSKICETSFNNSLESLKENEEMYNLLNYLKIIIEVLLLKDLFMYINTNKK